MVQYFVDFLQKYNLSEMVQYFADFLQKHNAK